LQVKKEGKGGLKEAQDRRRFVERVIIGFHQSILFY